MVSSRFQTCSINFNVWFITYNYVTIHIVLIIHDVQCLEILWIGTCEWKRPDDAPGDFLSSQKGFWMTPIQVADQWRTTFNYQQLPTFLKVEKLVLGICYTNRLSKVFQHIPSNSPTLCDDGVCFTCSPGSKDDTFARWSICSPGHRGFSVFLVLGDHGSGLKKKSELYGTVVGFPYECL